MFKTKIGFLPLNWDVWDVDNWGEQMRDRCIASMEKIEGIEIIVPSKDLTKSGCVGEDLEEAEKALKTEAAEYDCKEIAISKIQRRIKVKVETVKMVKFE